jgi:hypothetical protein
VFFGLCQAWANMEERKELLGDDLSLDDNHYAIRTLSIIKHKKPTQRS